MKTVFYGGAFDPFHSEHRALIEGARRELNADLIVVYPSFAPPHKANPGTSYELRLAMVQAGTADLPYVITDTIERDRNKTNYTYEVLPLLKKKYPSDEYYFLMGGDSLVNFHKWVKPEVIASEATLLVARRMDVPGYEEAQKRVVEVFRGKVKALNVIGKAVSSSTIKAKAELSLPQTDVCPEVEKIITKNGLYREYADVVEHLRATIPEKTFKHVCRTVLYALKLNTGLNLPYKKVFTACLLHDCAKHIKMQMEGVPAPVVHQYTGAEEAKKTYGVADEEVLSAIRYHTTGKPDMTTLEKLVYCADMLEEGRCYPGVDELRKVIESDFEKGFVMCAESSLNNVASSGNPVDPLTKACVSYYTEKKI